MTSRGAIAPWQRRRANLHSLRTTLFLRRRSRLEKLIQIVQAKPTTPLILLQISPPIAFLVSAVLLAASLFSAALLNK